MRRSHPKGSPLHPPSPPSSRRCATPRRERNPNQPYWGDVLIRIAGGRRGRRGDEERDPRAWCMHRARNPPDWGATLMACGGSPAAPLRQPFLSVTGNCLHARGTRGTQSRQPTAGDAAAIAPVVGGGAGRCTRRCAGQRAGRCFTSLHSPSPSLRPRHPSPPSSNTALVHRTGRRPIPFRTPHSALRTLLE